MQTSKEGNGGVLKVLKIRSESSEENYRRKEKEGEKKKGRTWRFGVLVRVGWWRDWWCGGLNIVESGKWKVFTQLRYVTVELIVVGEHSELCWSLEYLGIIAGLLIS